MNDGKKRKPQKHQNKTAFKIQFDTKAIDMQKKVSLHLLCVRCHEQLQWKLKYNKYKKITEPGKCNFCHEKNVVRSYMKSCDKCAEEKEACPKCLSDDKELPKEVKLAEKEKVEEQKEIERQTKDFIESLRERSRRTIRRKLQKGTISWDKEKKYFVDEEGQELVGLHFRKVKMDIDEDDLEDDLDDLEGEQEMLQVE